MPDIKKKIENDSNEPQEEHFEIDFDRIFLICRLKFGIDQHDAELLTLGKWGDIFHAYKALYNFETKQMLYADVERELEQYKAKHQPVTSLLNI
ncbi:MAG: hypothetical protein IJT37_10170 [Lachnospiraceae bacterium]|nr:hypothetical protein [Lachnospiraceae bacterium]